MKQPTAIECIGHTPLMAIPHFCEQEEALACVLVKLEKSNPFGSVKDRAALYIIRELEKAGIKATIIGKATAGNDRVLLNEDERRFLEPPKTDELYKVIGR